MKKLIELIFILDRSGSMSGLESDTIGGFNEMILKQKSLDGRVLATTVLFDNQYELLHDSVNLNDIKPLTTNDYFVRGTTALLDALGKTLTNTSNKHLKLEAKDRPDEVMFIITTDGMENASIEFNYEKVKKLIEDKKTNNNWQFIFLGANIDAAKEASKFGIEREFSADFVADSSGVKLSYMVINDAVSSLREGNEIKPDWKKAVDDDFKERK